jgi:hypothetical protein
MASFPVSRNRDGKPKPKRNDAFPANVRGDYPVERRGGTRPVDFGGRPGENERRAGKKIRSLNAGNAKD